MICIYKFVIYKQTFKNKIYPASWAFRSILLARHEGLSACLPRWAPASHPSAQSWRGAGHSDTSSQRLTPLTLDRKGPTVRVAPSSPRMDGLGKWFLAPCQFQAICIWKMVLPSLLLLLVFATPAKQCFMFPVPVVTMVSGASRIIPSALTG